MIVFIFMVVGYIYKGLYNTACYLFLVASKVYKYIVNIHAHMIMYANDYKVCFV